MAVIACSEMRLHASGLRARRGSSRRLVPRFRRDQTSGRGFRRRCRELGSIHRPTPRHRVRADRPDLVRRAADRPQVVDGRMTRRARRPGRDDPTCESHVVPVSPVRLRRHVVGRIRSYVCRAAQEAGARNRFGTARAGNRGQRDKKSREVKHACLGLGSVAHPVGHRALRRRRLLPALSAVRAAFVRCGPHAPCFPLS